MSKETLEELKAIYDGAPEKATHVDSEGNYLKHNENSDWFIWTCKHGGHRVIYTCNLDSVRSLSGIKRNIELMEALQGMLQVFCGVQDGYWRNELDAARKALGLKV